jgi:hypothetical protein
MKSLPEVFKMILGIPDPQILLGYGLAIGFTLACVVYGLLNWNKGANGDGS